MRSNFQMQNQNITMVKGDTLAFNVQVIDMDGNPMTVDSAYMTCKERPNSTDKVFQKSLANGIVQSDVSKAEIGVNQRHHEILFHYELIRIGNDGNTAHDRLEGPNI